MKKLFGTVVPIITPLTDKDTIDIDSLYSLIDHVIDGGLDGIYPCGTTGEMMYLSVEERKLVASETVKHVNERVPVFVHVGAWNTRDTVELARHAEEIGADGIGVVTPAFYKLRDRELVDFYITVAKSVSDDFPVYMYGIKQNAVNDINPEICEAVVKECPNVVGAKYSYSDMSMMQKLMLVNNGDFSVLAGPDKFFQIVYAAGGDGVVSGNSMCIPEHYHAIYEALKAGDYDLARKLQRRTNMLNDIMGKINNIAAYKTILKDEGIIASSMMRRPMENLPPEEEKALLEQMKQNNYRKVVL